MSGGFEVFLATMIAMTEQRRPGLVKILIVCDFTNMLPNEELSLLLVKVVEFAIDLDVDTTPISRVLYHMALSSRNSCRSCWIRSSDRVSHPGVLLSSSSGRRMTDYNCALTIECSTR